METVLYNQVSRVANHAITNAFNKQKNQESAVPCQNCPDGLLNAAACYCRRCGGFFCKKDDEQVHAINLFRSHERDYDTRNFAGYKVASANFVRMPSRLGTGVASIPEEVKTDVQDLKSGKVLAVVKPKASVPSDNNSVAGLSDLNDHGDDMEAKKRNRDLLKSLVRIRASLLAKIHSMERTLGLVENVRSKFEINREKLQELRSHILQQLKDYLYNLNISLSDRISFLSAAAQEIADRQVNIDALHLQRVQRGQLVNTRLIEMSLFLLEKDQVSVLMVEELEQILAYLNRFSFSRVTDIPYARGGFQFIEIPDELLRSVLQETLYLSDEGENDVFGNGESRVASRSVDIESYEVCRLFSRSPALFPRDVGNADLGYYYFAVKIVSNSSTNVWLRLGFIEKSTNLPDNKRLGDQGTNSFAFESSGSGELTLIGSTSRVPAQVQIAELVGDQRLAPKQWSVGDVVGVLFSPIEQNVQCFHNGRQSDVISLKNVNFTHDTANYQILNPAVAFDKSSTVVEIVFARFMHDLECMALVSAITPQ